MTQSIEKLFPFLENSDFIKTSDETVNVDDIYCPVSFNLNVPDNAQSLNTGLVQKKRFQAVRVQPSNILMVNEPDNILSNIVSKAYGPTINLNVVEYDYSEVASRIEVTDNVAYMKINEGYVEQSVVSDEFINTAANGVALDKEFYQNIVIPKTTQTINLIDWLNGFAEEEIMESADMFDSLLANVANGKETSIGLEENKDYVYKWLDSYFALPEGVSATQGGREVVPLLIGPTGVFKSATVKELCKKYDYRLVDFRVAFTSRLDYSGLFQMGEVDDKKYSYACPMEEIVTCSDGFREYCRRAYDRVSQILAQGYILTNKSSDGENTEGEQTPISDEQRKNLEKLLSQYKEYMKVPVLFFDEITRCVSGNTKVIIFEDGKRVERCIKDIPEGKEVAVLTSKHNGDSIDFKIVRAVSKGITKKDADNLVDVTIKDKGTVRCTDDHLWKLYNGSYSRADDLIDGVSLLLNGYTVESVVKVPDVEDAYDLEVLDGDNFAISVGGREIFIHNCKDAGVEGLLTEMLNQKRFNNMQMQGCKFVAATNLNLKSRTNMRHNDMMDELDEMYDVNTDLDVAYSNRFLPLRVQPEDVQDRWFDWAKKEKTTPTNTIQNIHPLIIEFLNQRPDMIYNDTPVLDALDRGLTENETKSQVYPNYRTWDMLSGYLYKIDRDYELDNKEKADTNSQTPKLYKKTIINGLISVWGASAFIPFLESNGYQEYSSVKGEVDDEYTDFLETSLDSNVPALLVGPSSMGKTTRVKSYVKKQKDRTGLEPVLINVDLSAKDVVDLMGMPTKVNLVDYVAGSDLNTLGLGDVGKELSSIVDGVCKEQKYGLSNILTVRAPDMDIKERLVKAKQEGRDVIFMLDELNRVKNTSVLSAAFEIISDSRFAGVSFADMKDKVKVVGACNMAHSEMDDAGDYGSAGSIDPALAARFSIFWKKHYDEKDVKSWISYMEQEKKDGKIDGVVLEYFKTLDPEKAVEIISKVEKRQLAYAEPSTRNLHQLSMDIKSMRGKSDSKDAKLFYGKLLFDTMTRDEFGNLYDSISSSTHNEVDIANNIKKLAGELLDNKDVWDAAIAGKSITLNGNDLSAGDLMDNLSKCIDEINKLILIPLDSEGKKKLNTLNKLAADLMRACSDLDDIISQERESIFETYVGEGFAREFTPFFNENFGSENDVEITIEMLSDKSLIKPFFRKYRSSRTSFTEEKYEDSIIDLLGEFYKVHGEGLQPDVYAAFIDGANASLASSDGIERILRSASGDADKVFAKAEEVGDSWILNLLSYTRITQADIDSIRAKMSSGVQRKRKSVVL